MEKIKKEKAKRETRRGKCLWNRWYTLVLAKEIRTARTYQRLQTISSSIFSGRRCCLALWRDFRLLVRASASGNLLREDRRLAPSPIIPWTKIRSINPFTASGAIARRHSKSWFFRDQWLDLEWPSLRSGGASFVFFSSIFHFLFG